MDFNDETTMTKDDVIKGKANREEHLIEVRTNYDEYQKSKNNSNNVFNEDTTVFASPTATKNYKF